MRVVPIVNAVLVSAALYMLVFERDRLLAFAARDTEEEAAAQSEDMAGAVSVQVMASTAQQVDQGVLTRGQTEAARRVDVRAETTGPVISEPLRRGALVQAGDVLCRLDPGTRAANLSEAEARLAEAQLSANAAEKLQQGGFRSETITAPFAGLLESDTAELGALLSAGMSCATVIALDPVKLVGFVPETEVDQVREGAQVGARLATGREILGRVTFLSRAADPATRTFRVEAEVPNPDLTIREGQTVEMVIAADGTQAHFLPASALTLNDEGRLGVRIVIEGRAQFAPVDLLRDTPDGVWLAGLPDQAQVIVVGQEYVTEGTPLSVHEVEPAQ